MKNLFIEDTINKIDQEVELYGWVDTKRDHRKVIFIDLRDRSGLVQVVGGEELKHLSTEDVVYIKGIVKKRPEKLINPKLKTGSIEIEAKEFKILNKSEPLPLPIDTDGQEIEEEVRLKYRYLDLRRKRLLNNITLRSKFVQLVREFLFNKKFIEIETPMLSMTTPEGSRDFLVPSRMQKGKFYALPQSPQQYKQLLMTAGFERYFQIARCMRDEDLRADRGFEHTQIDIEMSFVEREDVMKIDEELMTTVVEKMGFKIKQKPFPVFTYAEAMKKFGADKFDLRTEEDKKNGILAFAWVVDFPFFEKTDTGGWTFTHNPFSAPLPQFKDALLKKENIGDILTSQYDLVCNGYEVGGGSVRGHEASVLRTVFEIMGYAKERIDKEFGHMIQAFQFGTPPHGGLAHGIERVLMTLLNEKYLREVVAFPMTAGGKTAVMDAPSDVTDEQLRELGISVVNRKKISVLQQIRDLLNEYKIKFNLMNHAPVKTSEEAAAIRGTELKQGAKALIMYADEKPIMIVLAAHRKIDNAKFKTTYKIKDLRMAKPEEVKEVTNTEIGAVPPFGNLFDIGLYVDTSLGENETIVFNAGTHTDSISMSYKDFEKASKPIVGDFSK